MVDAGRLARPRSYARARSDSGKGKNVNARRRHCAAKAFKKGPIVPGGVLVVPEPTDSDEEIMPTDSDEESEPRSISPESREAGDPHVIDLTTEA